MKSQNKSSCCDHHNHDHSHSHHHSNSTTTPTPTKQIITNIDISKEEMPTWKKIALQSKLDLNDPPFQMTSWNMETSFSMSDQIDNKNGMNNDTNVESFKNEKKSKKSCCASKKCSSNNNVASSNINNDNDDKVVEQDAIDTHHNHTHNHNDNSKSCCGSHKPTNNNPDDNETSTNNHSHNNDHHHDHSHSHSHNESACTSHDGDKKCGSEVSITIISNFHVYSSNCSYSSGIISNNCNSSSFLILY